MSDARWYAVWPEARSRSRSLKGSRPSVPHGTNFCISVQAVTQLAGDRASHFCADGQWVKRVYIRILPIAISADPHVCFLPPAAFQCKALSVSAYSVTNSAYTTEWNTRKWCSIESAYGKPIYLLYFFAYQFPERDVALVRISEKVKQSDNFVYAITKYVSLPLTLSSLTVTVILTPKYSTPSLTNDDSYLQQYAKKLDFKLKNAYQAY